MRPGRVWDGALLGSYPWGVDGLLAVSLTTVSCLVGSEYHPAGWPPFDLRAYLLTGLVCLPLAVRRRFPMATLVASNAAFAGYLLAGYQPSLNFWGPAVAL